MAQGALKVIKKSGTKKSLTPKKAAKKIIAPRKNSAIATAKLKKKHSSAIAVGTEKLLSSRVGHLEVLKGSRREIAKKEALKQAKERIAKRAEKSK
ncbi:uncharacterized protein V2V93DRAFT_362074 [Kockiozyma suomiensis]|uniref:uncharacterized protein n=1 Tax=Kockiozyma suomiensis TaxID=1337062 RepID=UPI0033432B49